MGANRSPFLMRAGMAPTHGECLDDPSKSGGNPLYLAGRTRLREGMLSRAPKGHLDRPGPLSCLAAFCCPLHDHRVGPGWVSLDPIDSLATQAGRGRNDAHPRIGGEHVCDGLKLRGRK